MTESNILPASVNSPSVFRDADLAAIGSFADAVKALEAFNVAVEKTSDYGTGFVIVKDKNVLIGVDFLILDWRFTDSSKYEGDFVSAACVTKDGRKLILNDGSTGIRDQLKLVTSERIKKGHDHPQAGILVQNGLVRSDYDYTDEKGKTTKASTFYLSE